MKPLFSIFLTTWLLHAEPTILDIQYDLSAHTATITVKADEKWQLWKGVDLPLSGGFYTEWTQLTPTMHKGTFTVTDTNAHPKQGEHYEIRYK